MDDDIRTIPSLMGDALNQFVKLFQTEVDLAKAEFSGKARETGQAVSLIAAGAVFVIPALTMALFALSSALIAAGWPEALGNLCSAFIASLIAAGFFVVGLRRLSTQRLAPTQTLEQLEKDKDTIKGLAR